VELAGALNDFARGVLADYQHLRAEDCIISSHSRERIRELSDSLARLRPRRMAARGVTFKLNARVADARPRGGVDARRRHSHPDAGVDGWHHAKPPVKTCRSSMTGVVLWCRPHTAVPSHAGVWAVGDCAAITDAKTGKPFPPTAQLALREAQILAQNIHASLRGRSLIPFHSTRGARCASWPSHGVRRALRAFARHKTVRPACSL
jgi:NADH dehydrogenase